MMQLRAGLTGPWDVDNVRENRGSNADGFTGPRDVGQSMSHARHRTVTDTGPRNVGQRFLIRNLLFLFIHVTLSSELYFSVSDLQYTF